MQQYVDIRHPIRYTNIIHSLNYRKLDLHSDFTSVKLNAVIFFMMKKYLKKNPKDCCERTVNLQVSFHIYTIVKLVK